MEKRALFKSKFGMIAAVGGSVIGLGNIWRFPYLAGENGGAAFIFVYIVVCLLVSVPIMLSEFAIGRYGQNNSVGSIRKAAPGTKWEYVGLLGVLTSFILLSFYSVVAGWSLEFIKESVIGGFVGKDSVEIKEGLTQFINSGWQPVVWSSVFIILSCIVVLSGIEKGIERYNKVMMPLIVVILVVMIIYTSTMDGFGQGVAFLFNPDFSKITPSVVLQAIGQSFFSLSLGMGTMITYGSYINKKANLGKLAFTISFADMTVAILSGLAIFPAVFSMGINPTSGPDLVFITLPGVFNQMSGGYFISIIFFFLLFFASITSSVSLIELIVAYLKEEYKFKRLWSVIICGLLLLGTATITALSQVEGSSLMIMGSNLFDFFDNATAIVLLPLGAVMTIIFAGWFMRKNILGEELSSGGIYKVPFLPVLMFIIRFVAPVAIVLLFLNLVGVF